MEELHIFVVMFENMFNPSLVRQAGHKEYEGTRATTIKTFKSGKTNSTIQVERPPRFVQRAYADVQCTIQATTDETIIDLDAASSFRRIDAEQNGKPHDTDVTYFEFPLLKMANSCTFKPDRAQNGEYYVSNPSRLLRLINYLSGRDEWLRTTQCLNMDYVVETPGGTETLLSTVRTTYKWRLYDDPGQNIVITTQGSKYYLPPDYVCLDAAGTQPFRYIPVTRNRDLFTTTATTIYVPVARFSRQIELAHLKDRADFTHGGIELKQFIFVIPSRQSVVGDDGFAHFRDEDDRDYGLPYVFPLDFVGVVLDDGTGDQEIFGAHPTLATFLATMGAGVGGDPFAERTYNECIAARLIAPQVRFALTQEYSFHGIGKRLAVPEVGDRDYSIFHKREQFVEACAGIVANITQDVREEFFGPKTNGVERTQVTFINDSKAIRATQIQFMKYNSEAKPDSLMDWSRIDAQFRNKLSDVEIQLNNQNAGGFFQPDMVVNGESIVRFEMNSTNTENLTYMHSLITFQYNDSGIRKFYIAPVINVSPTGAGLINVDFDVFTDCDDEKEAEDLMFPFGEMEAAEVSPASLNFRRSHNGQVIGDFSLQDDGNGFHQETDHPLFLYFGLQESTDDNPVAGLGVKWTNLLLPNTIRISEELETDTFLLYSDKTIYDTDDTREYQSLFKFELELQTIGGEERQTLKIYHLRNPAPTRCDADDHFTEYGTFQFLRHPEPRANTEIGPAALEPIGTFPNISPSDEALHTLYDGLGDRIVGWTIKSSDPLLCGPLSCAPLIKVGRPIDNGAIMLPPRLGTYEINYELAPKRMTAVNGNVYNVARHKDSTIDVCCEYLTQPAEQNEEHIFHVPKFITFVNENPVVGVPRTHTLSNGRPQYLYIEHDGLLRFAINYRDDPCPVLLEADRFDFFKMFNRSIHKSSRKTFNAWIHDRSPYLIRWEELGSWGQLFEDMDRLLLEFEMLEISPTCSFVDVHYVYENHYLRSSEHSTKFTFN